MHMRLKNISDLISEYALVCIHASCPVHLVSGRATDGVASEDGTVGDGVRGVSTQEERMRPGNAQVVWKGRTRAPREVITNEGT